MLVIQYPVSGRADLEQFVFVSHVIYRIRRSLFTLAAAFWINPVVNIPGFQVPILIGFVYPLDRLHRMKLLIKSHWRVAQDSPSVALVPLQSSYLISPAPGGTAF